MNYRSNKTYRLLYIFSVVILSALAVAVSFTILNFPPQLHTNIYLVGLEQTAQVAIPIWLIIVLLEIYSTYSKETYRDLLIDVFMSLVSVYINTIGIYSIFILTLFEPTKVVSILAITIILLLLVVFSVVSFRNKAKDETLITAFKNVARKALNAIFYISIILCIVL